MATLLSVNGVSPKWGKDCFFAPNATLTGDVLLGERCSVWFNAVIRGDVHSIRIGDETNIQDGAIIHCTFKKATTQIGSRVSIGHRAMIHGCSIEDDVLIGMGSILLDNCQVGKGCIVGAGSLVLENTILDPGFLYAGSPVRQIKPVTKTQKEAMARTAKRYPEYGSWYDFLSK
jgi:carbonic anhydrase/acetyltransferase-like protein (isoleucine patch superfamily)